MKLEQSFDVAAPVERVWQALIDVERVAPCLPGAAITGKNEDGSYNGTFTIKIGPTTAAYTGKLQMESIDEAAHSATMSAQGSDKRGQGGASATIASHVEPAGDGRARVVVDTDYHITGRLARFGRGGMIEDISERLLKEFAQRLAASLEGAGDESAAEEAAPAEPKPPTPPDSPAPAAPPPTASPPPPSPPPPPPPVPPPRPSPPPPPPPASEPLDAGSMVGSMLAERVRANRWPLIAAAFVLWRLLRRRR